MIEQRLAENTGMAKSVQHASDRLVSRHTNPDGFVVWPVTLERAKDRTQVWHDADDPVLDPERYGIVSEAVDMVESESGIALITQVREVVWEVVPTAYELPVFPVQSIDSITYTDANDTTQTDATPAVYLIGHGRPPRFTLTTLTPIKPVVVRYTAGYGDTVDSIPPRWVSIIQQAISYLWHHRDPSADASKKFRHWLGRAIDAAGGSLRYP